MKAAPFFRLWGGPIAMAVLSATGLVSALVSDRWGDWWSWLALGIPVAVIGWSAWPRAPARPCDAARAPPGQRPNGL